MIIDEIKRMKDDLEMKSGKPEKLCMNLSTFHMMVEELLNTGSTEVIAVGDETDESHYNLRFFVCGLEAEIRNDLDKDTLVVIK